MSSDPEPFFVLPAVAAPSAPFLALVATPIGHLGDLTFRALATLRAADLVAAEDTRRAHILLQHYGLKSRLVSYHAHNEHHVTERLLCEVRNGQSVAVLTDAGTPALSDPGFLLVREARRVGIEPVIIPGVSALTFAVAAAGLPVERFSFHGFLPVKSGRRLAALERIAREGQTVFLFESPHRIGKLLAEIAEHLGPDTEVAVIREATKLHEEVLRGTAAELVAATADRNWKGEITVGIFPPEAGRHRPPPTEDGEEG
jgi:16S rRNA (cytidine1402-2'-O)-methyltransferase